MTQSTYVLHRCSSSTGAIKMAATGFALICVVCMHAKLYMCVPHMHSKGKVLKICCS